MSLEKQYFVCVNCKSLYLYDNSSPSKCQKCDSTQFEFIDGRFILRCRKCGLTQNKSAFNALHGQTPLRCQATSCGGPIKVIQLGKQKLSSAQSIKVDRSPPKLEKIHSPSPIHQKIPEKGISQQEKLEDKNLPFPKPKQRVLPKVQKKAFIPFPVKTEEEMAKIKIELDQKDHPGIHDGDILILDGDKYEITSKLGTGGMGAVWSGRNTTSNKKVAIKEFYYARFHDSESGNNHCEKYWTREAKITQIQSESPEATMHYIGKLKIEKFHTPEYYIFLEYIEGTVLDVWFTNRFKDLSKLTLSELQMILKDILMPIARHMYFVHQKGIVHRDLTVQNVMITKKSRYAENEVKPIVIDYGVAKEVGLENMFSPRKPYYISSAPEATGIRNRGTPPEVMAGFEPIAATDIYMLGHIMFYIFSGGHYAGAAATNEDFVLHPADFNPDLHPNFNLIVEYCTAYEPADRMENMSKLYDAMNYLLQTSDNNKISSPETINEVKKKHYYLFCDYNQAHILLPERQVIQIGRDEIISAGTEHSMDGHLYNSLIPTENNQFSFELYLDSNYAYIRDFHSKMGTFICNLTATNQQVYNNIPIKGLDNVQILLSEANLGKTTIEVPFIAPDGITYRIQFKIVAQEG